MVEAVAALLLLVPLLLGLQALANLQAANGQVTQAARFLAMSASLGGRSLGEGAEPAQLAEFFPPTRAAGAWSRQVLRGNEPAAAAAVTQRTSRALAPAGRIAGVAATLEQRGWVSADARVAVPVPAVIAGLFAPAPLTPHARMVLLTEDGAAVGRAEVAERLKPLAVMAPMRAVLARMRPVANLLGLMDPSFRALCSAAPNPDLLPADRLIGGRWQAPRVENCR